MGVVKESTAEFESKVREKHPRAICKRVGVDNGSNSEPRYVVFKVDSLLSGDAISVPCVKVCGSWEDAYRRL